MSINSKTELTLKEIITGFGFVEGLWLAIGINPEAEVLKAFTKILTDLGVDSGSLFLLKILPVIFLIATVLTVYRIGGILGLVAVGCAFLGGLLILLSPNYPSVPQHIK